MQKPQFRRVVETMLEHATHKKVYIGGQAGGYYEVFNVCVEEVEGELALVIHTGKLTGDMRTKTGKLEALAKKLGQEFPSGS